MDIEKFIKLPTDRQVRYINQSWWKAANNDLWTDRMFLALRNYNRNAVAFDERLIKVYDKIIQERGNRKNLNKLVSKHSLIDKSLLNKKGSKKSEPRRVKLKSGETGFFYPDEMKDKRNRTFVYLENNPDDYILAYEHNFEFVN